MKWNANEQSTKQEGLGDCKKGISGMFHYAPGSLLSNYS
jgi:hypothetical protein